MTTATTTTETQVPDLYPTRGTAEVLTPAPPLPPQHRRLPGGIPVLLLGGDRDLSTPVEWLYDQKKLTPRAEVVVVEGVAHSVQSRAAGDKGRQAVYDFLLGR